MRFRGQNPVYRSMNDDFAGDYTDQATYIGVTLKSTLLLLIVGFFAVYFGKDVIESGTIPFGIGFLIMLPIIGMISVFIALRNPELSMIFAIIYAGVEGAFLGIVSGIYALMEGNDIIMVAVLGTLGVLGGMLFLYSTGIIRVGSKFKKFLMSALIGIIFASILLMVGSMFGALDTTAGYGIYIGISVLSTILASFFLLYDFDIITNMVESGAPKKMEWTLALGLVVTLVWLYIELLRLIAIFRD